MRTYASIVFVVYTHIEYHPQRSVRASVCVKYECLNYELFARKHTAKFIGITHVRAMQL